MKHIVWSLGIVTYLTMVGIGWALAPLFGMAFGVAPAFGWTVSIMFAAAAALAGFAPVALWT